MTKRKVITPAMKVKCLLFRHFTPCSACGQRLKPEDKIEWDHIHALVHDGPHEHSNLRPLHKECHKPKTKADVAAKAKGDRILGLTCNGPKKKMRSRGFDKTKTRKFSGEVVVRS